MLEFSEPLTTDECRQLIEAYDWQAVQHVLTGREGAIEALGLAEVPQEVLQCVAQRCGLGSYRVLKEILAHEVSEGRL